MALGDTSGYLLSGLDYALFTLVLVISSLIGLYYGFLSKNKQNSPEEYFLGGRKMGVFPISISLVVSSVSGIAIVGHTADVYAHGTHQWQYVFSVLLAILVIAFILLPVFYELQLPSSFSYLQLRFGRVVQLIASFMYLVTTTLYVSINIYVPALVLNHLAGFSISFTIVVLGCVCIFYTVIGGFRAVIWADLFQSILMVGSCSIICYIGFGVSGGVEEVWEASKRGKRLVLFNLNPNPTIRLSTWTILFGHSIIASKEFGLAQTSVQRFLSMSSLQKARKALVLFGLEFILFMFFTLVMAIVIFAYYETCDPLRSERIQQLDQIVSLFVTEIVDHFPGLPGLFVAGIFAGSLSTMSSCLNSSTVCLYEDFLRPFLPDMSNERTCKMLKLLTLFLGCVEIALVFFVMKLGTIFVIFIIISGLTSGSMLGLFTMGMLIPKANHKGALVGTISSIICVGTIIIGSLSKKAEPLLPMRTDECQHNFTLSVITDHQEAVDDLPWIFRISFMYYATVGFLIVYLVGYPVSLLTGGNEITDQRLLATFMRKKSLVSPRDDVEEHFLSEVNKYSDK